MRFVHGVERNLYFLEHRNIFCLGQGFRCYIKQFCGSGKKVVADFCELGFVQGRIQEVGDAVVSCHETSDGIDLILHKCDEG